MAEGPLNGTSRTRVVASRSMRFRELMLSANNSPIVCPITCGRAAMMLSPKSVPLMRERVAALAITPAPPLSAFKTA